MPVKVPWLEGVFPALVTPFAKDEEFDEKAYRHLIRHVLPHVNGLVPCGTTGEFPYLSVEEQKRIVGVAVEEAGDKPVIAGTGAAGTRQVIELARNPDILLEVASQRETSGRPLAVVGFAAETEDLLANAREKLTRKRLDLIVANDVSAADSGFAVDTNRVTLVDAKGGITPLPLFSKVEVAEMILDQVVTLLDR